MNIKTQTWMNFMFMSVFRVYIIINALLNNIFIVFREGRRLIFISDYNSFIGFEELLKIIQCLSI